MFRSGLFAEGWAVYVTQVMLDRGYGDDDPALWLNHWKYYLRCVTNTIIDVRIHTMGMTTDEAVALMVDGAFQERGRGGPEGRAGAAVVDPAVDVLRWARSGCGTSSTRLAGGPRWRPARRPTPCPTPRVVGGYPDTPGFDERAHLEAVISHGAPPIPILRRILLDEA